MKNNFARWSKPGGFIIACISNAVLAQSTVAGSALSNPTPGISTPAPSPAADESKALDSRAIVINPRITLTETWSDNVALSLGKTNGKESGFITELAPGIRIEAKTARLKAYFDYALREQLYTTPSGSNRSQNSLNTFGTLEAVSNWLFVDFSGVIAQQAISAFGQQSPSNANINSNSTETSTYRVSPYIRGNFSGIVEYSLRYNRSTTQSSASTVSNIDLSEWAGQLRGSTPFQNLRWSLDAIQQTADYSLGRKTDDQRLSATATYTIVPQFRVSVGGGNESNNYASVNQETHPTHSFGFEWNPTERTEIAALKDQRFFGEGHRFSFSHRFPLSVIRYSDTRDVSVLPNQFASVGLGTIFQLFYQLCSQSLSGTITDPTELDQLASKCALNNIPAGIPPGTQVISSFLSSRATLQRRQELSMAFQGARNTLTVVANRNESQSLLATAGLPDDFAGNSNIRQRGISINLLHRLSGVSSLNFTASRQESTSTSNSAIKATTTIYLANLTSKLGPKTTGGISVRRTEFDSTINPYTENALIGTISVVF